MVKMLRQLGFEIASNVSLSLSLELLLDVLNGDASLFTRGDAIELAWELVDKVIAGWEGESAPPLFVYEKGSWGPEAAADLIRHDGFNWAVGCGE